MGDTTQLELDSLDCAVCLQKCHHPTQLPCGHIFCFLCVKGVAIQNKKCAMCRTAIPPDYLDNPVILEKLSNSLTPEESASDNHQWYYEGRNGWWKYDERSNSELEAAWSVSATECVLLLAGALYRIDFATMVQTRRNDHTRRRRVRRDTPTLPAKGIAGIKIIDNEDNQSKNSQIEDIRNEQEGNDDVHATAHSQVASVNEVNENDNLLNTMRTMSIEDSAADTTQQHSSVSSDPQESRADSTQQQCLDPQLTQNT